MAPISGSPITYLVGQTDQDDERTANLGADLDDTTLTYVYRITITNNFSSGGSNIEVELEDLFEGEAWITADAVDVAGTAAVKDAEFAKLQPGETVIYTFSYTVTPNNAPVEGEFPVGSHIILERA